MITLNWQLKTPLDAVIFDCDGTLSSIEGIDELAKYNGHEEAVKALTAEAMGRTGVNPEMYRQRLEMVKPTRENLEALSLAYWDHRVAHASEVISIFKRLGKSVYLVSAGLHPAVLGFAIALGIEPGNVFAVGIEFHEDGVYFQFDSTSPLVHREGKREIVTSILQSHPRAMFIGDGLNDLVVRDLVTRFVGYGGEFYRENIAKQCEFYIKTKSLAGLLALGLTEEEIRKLSASELELYNQGKQEW